MTTKIGRRTLLKSAGAASALAVIGAPKVHAQAIADLKLAVVLGLTGGYAIHAAELKRGIDLAVDVVNQKGLEIGGKKYRIASQYYDDKTESATAARMVERAVSSDRSHMILASGGSVIVKANLAVAQRLRAPMMAIWAQVDGIYASQKGDPWLFSATPPFSLMYRDVVKMIAGLKNPEIKTIGMVTPNDELGVYTGREYFPEDLKQAGGGMKLVGVEYYPSGSQEYTTSLARLRRQTPDCLVVNALGNDIIGIIKEMQSINWWPKCVVVESPSGLREALGKSLEGLVVPIMWDPSLTTTRDEFFGTSADFTALYKTKFGNPPPDFSAALGAHDLIAYVQVMKKAGVVDNARSIKAAFQSYQGETFFGGIGFRDDGLNVRAPLYPGQFQGGLPRLVYPPQAKTHDIIHPYPGSV